MAARSRSLCHSRVLSLRDSIMYFFAFVEADMSVGRSVCVCVYRWGRVGECYLQKCGNRHSVG